MVRKTELSEPDDLSRLMLDGIGQAVVATDLEGIVTYWNAAATRIYGWAADEAIGRPVEGLLVPPPGSLDANAMLELLAADGSWSGEFVSRRRDGSPFPALVSLSGIVDDHNVIGTISVTTDLTERAEEALRSERREARWHSLVAQSADVATIADAETNVITYVSPVATRLFGWLPEDLVGRRGRTLVHPEDGERLASALKIVAEDPTAHPTIEFRLLCKDGSYRWVEETMSNLIGEDGVNGLVANLRDISGRRAAEDALRASEARYRLMAETAQEGIWTTDPQGRTLFANQKMADLLGFGLPEIYARDNVELAGFGDRDELARRVRDRLHIGAETYEVSYTRPDGSHLLLRIAASPLLQDGCHLGSLAMVADVTAARRAENKLRYRAFHDPLTGLPNRAMLLERLQECLDADGGSTELPLAVLVADIDHFKLVNDSFGHACGDDLLIEVSRRWERLIAANDMVARLGGDEFVILCTGASEPEARQIASRLLDALVEPILLDGRHIAISASIGIALAPTSETSDAATMLRYADAAMYEVKAHGRGRTGMFDSRLITEARHRLDLYNDLKEALQRDELTLSYQPVIELATGRLLGVEALCRWTHPRHGYVPLTPSSHSPSRPA